MNSQRPTRRGFTLIEILVAVSLITILTSLLFVAVGRIVRSSRETAEKQFMRSIALQIDTFEKQFGFLPPLVNDDDPIAAATTRSDGTEVPMHPRLRGEAFPSVADDTGPSKYLRYEVNPGEPRYSTLSLSYFMLGTMGKPIDGIDGAGFTAPNADGTFSFSGKNYEPMFDLGANSERLQRELTGTGAAQGYRTVVNDRWGTPIRFYRWTPVKHELGAGKTCLYRGWDSNGGFNTAAEANVPGRKGEIRSYNTPLVVGNPYVETSLRGARWAIVSAGVDKTIDDGEPTDAENKDNIILWEGGQ